jgi:hypothetical protein
MKFGVNFAVFVLFFGLALVEAIQSQNWLKAVIFLLLGIISLFADSRNKN